MRDGETEQVWDPDGRCCGGAAEPRRRRGPLAAELGVAVWLGFLVARWWKMRFGGGPGRGFGFLVLGLGWVSFLLLLLFLFLFKVTQSNLFEFKIEFEFNSNTQTNKSKLQHECNIKSKPMMKFLIT